MNEVGDSTLKGKSVQGTPKKARQSVWGKATQANTWRITQQPVCPASHAERQKFCNMNLQQALPMYWKEVWQCQQHSKGGGYRDSVDLVRNQKRARPRHPLDRQRAQQLDLAHAPQLETRSPRHGHHASKLCRQVTSGMLCGIAACVKVITMCIAAIYAQVFVGRRPKEMESDEESVHWRRKFDAASASSTTQAKVGLQKAATKLTTQQKLDSTLEECIHEGLGAMKPPPPKAGP
eukprot:4845451-Amphidinium_carterae.1